MAWSAQTRTEAIVEQRDWTDPCIEPTLTEILSDPMMDLVFRRDSLRRDNVEKLLRDQALRLAATRNTSWSCRCG